MADDEIDPNAIDMNDSGPDPLDDVIAAINSHDPNSTPSPSIDDEIRAELDNTPKQIDASPRIWDDYVDGSIVEGGQIEMTGDEVPSAADIAATPKLGSTSNAQRGSTSRSHSGYAGGPRAVEDDFDRERNKALGAFDAVAPDYDQDVINAERNFEALRGASAEKAQLREQFHAAEASIWDQLDDLNETHTQLLRHMQEQSKIEKERILGEARQQMAAVRQLVQQDPNPLHTLGTTQKLGLGMAAFAQGFLAPRGIHLNVTGQIDNMVQTALKEHQTNIQNAREGVQDTLHMYDIARQSSEDDYEALMRYKAMMIEGSKVQLQAHAARFNSQLAMSSAAEMEARLNMEQEAVLHHIADRRVTAQLAYLKHGADVAKEKGKLKLEKDAQAVAWYRANTDRLEHLRQKKKDEKEGSEMQPTLVMDPTNVQRDAAGKALTGGKYIGQINWTKIPKAIHEKVYNDTMKHQVAYDKLARGIDNLRKLSSDLGTKYGPDWYKEQNSEAVRTYKGQVALVMGDYMYSISGASYTDAQKDYYAKTIDPGTWLKTDYDEARKKLTIFQEHARGGYDSALNAAGVERFGEKDDRGYAPKPQEADPAQSGRFEVETTKSKPVATAVSKDYKEAIDVTGGADDPDKPFAEAPTVDAAASWKKLMGTEKEPSNADSVRHLVAAVIAPDDFRRHMKPDPRNPWDGRRGHAIPDDDTVLAQQGYEALSRLAEVPANKQNPNSTIYGDVPIYGRKWLELIKTDPDAAKALYRANDAAW